MGFILDIAKPMFDRIVGIDITPAMLEKVDQSGAKGSLTLELSQVEEMKFANDSFGVCTAYAVLHHLHELKPAFREIFRVLKPGGIFYSDTDPNSHFWKAFSELSDDGAYSDIVRRELHAVKYKDQELEASFGISPVLRVGELSMRQRLNDTELRATLKEVGFVMEIR